MALVLTEALHRHETHPFGTQTILTQEREPFACGLQIEQSLCSVGRCQKYYEIVILLT